jgi:predicted nucleotide-binding protein
MEKIEAHGDVGFAVVLLTPDDEGRKIDGNLQFRARQNVMLELGYFIGRLGRSNVCALTRGSVELPSDFAGIVYQAMEDGWRAAVARELADAGFEIDWEKVSRS